MTDNEIIKAFEQIDYLKPETVKYSSPVPPTFVLACLKRLKAENDDLFYKLQGVMWFVDKWLDGDELKQDEVSRAVTMREKTLLLVEEQDAEIERLKKPVLLVTNNKLSEKELMRSLGQRLWFAFMEQNPLLYYLHTFVVMGKGGIHDGYRR